MEINHEEWLSCVLAGVKSSIMTRFCEDNKVAMAALQQEFEGKLTQEIVVHGRLSEELASAKGELAAAALACQEEIVAEVEMARVALSNNYDRKLATAPLAAEKKYAAEVEGMKKKSKSTRRSTRKSASST